MHLAPKRRRSLWGPYRSKRHRKTRPPAVLAFVLVVLGFVFDLCPIVAVLAEQPARLVGRQVRDFRQVLNLNSWPFTKSATEMMSAPLVFGTLFEIHWCRKLVPRVLIPA
jgi:hypothetical protein